MQRAQDKRKRVVLVIDSDLTKADGLENLLNEKGFSAYKAGTLNEALSLAEEKRVVVAFLAMGRPDLDSRRLIASLKRRKDGIRIPVIVILEAFVEDLVASALKAGAVDYLIWPVDPDELVRRTGVHARLKEDDSAMARSLHRYEKQFETGDVGLFFTSKDGELLECNENLVKMLGYDSKDELLHCNVEETIYLNPGERHKFRKAVEKKGVIKNFRVTFRQKDGNPITTLISGQVVRDDRGDIIGYRGKNIPLPVSETASLGKSILTGLLPRLSGGYQSLFSASELLGHRYEKITRLGIGSFGEVWKVRDVLKDPPLIFVAKIPLSRKLNAKFEKEANMLIKLAAHSGVPKFHELMEVKNKRVLIQEFVEGKTLMDVIERELEEEKAESVIIQLTDIVAHAHRLRIIHRDIKPGNVMVKPDGQIKLLDFGAAKDLKEKEVSDTVTGSRPYMSPEQIMGKSQRRSDVWALGVVMYVLYTGVFPFYHDVEKVLMDMILELPVTPPSRFNEDINPLIEQIILKCLEKNPENRYPNAGSLKNDILETLPGYGDKVLPLY